MERNEYLKKFNRCVTEYNGILNEAEGPMPGGPMDDQGGDMGPGGAPMDGPMGGPMGGDDQMGGGAPMDGPMGPDGGAPMDGGMPMQGGEGGEEPTGFSPEGVDPNAPVEGMGGEEQPQGIENGPMPEQPAEEDEVIDVDDLTTAQEKTEKKVDALADKFEKTLKILGVLAQKIQDSDEHTNQYLENIKMEIEKRNPTPMQRMSMRSAKSAPYGMTPSEYMQNYAPENYSMEDDNNGADDEQYVITKSDIDNFGDYNAIARDLNKNNMGLKDILGY